MAEYPTTYEELISFLMQPKNDEGLDHDFKKGLPHPGDAKGISRLNKCFCAFANTRGGRLFFGVDDNKNCIGIEYNKEFAKHLSDKLSKEIKPEILRWQVLEPIAMPDGNRLIYVTHINECSSYHKPHLFGGIAYFRIGSSCVAIKDGSDLRRRLDVDRFSPNHIEILESKLDALIRFKLTPDALDVLYLNSLQVFLDRNANSQDIAGLLASFLEMRKLFTKLLKIGSAYSFEAPSSPAPEEELLRDELKEKIGRFTKQFRQIFIGGVEST